jgi:hypothetical protein
MSSSSRGETYAFLVGVSKYENKENVRSLEFARDDVIAFGGVLRNSGVPSKYIVILHDQQPSARFQPTCANIKREFHLLLATLEPEDALIVALAGHGAQLGPGGDNYFLPTDAQLSDPEKTLINIKTIYEEMEHSRAGRKLLLVDACRNDPQDDGSRGVGVSLLPMPRSLVSNPLPKGIAALFSCDNEQKSFEDKKLRHGVFFHEVIEAWKGEADSDLDGQVTLMELENFVRRETKNYVRDALEKIQTPVFKVDSPAFNGWVVSSLTRPRMESGPSLQPQVTPLPGSGSDGNAAKTLLARGKGHLAQGQFAEAVLAYTQAIRLDAKDASSYLGRAVAEGATGELPAALADYEQALRLDPGLVVAHVGQGAILARLGRLDEAIAASSRAIELDARNAKAYYNRGVAREAKKDRAGADRDFQKAAQLDPRLKGR